MKKDRGRYVAIAELPVVYCSYGPTPDEACRQMAKLLKENKVKNLLSGTISFTSEDDLYGMTVYV